ncbi:MAG: hypothetical protein C0478_15520 [Planctomyces sp.]|nr:hypothetical protein [Planctomyces sp.]
MAISEERKTYISLLATGGIFDNLSSEESDAFTEDDCDRPYREFFASVTDPEELHVFASFYNWDGGDHDLLQVLHHPLCDLGTALLIYWRSQPGFYLEYRNFEEVGPAFEDGWHLLRKIEGMVAAGSFRTSTQPFDPANDEGEDLRPNPEEIRRHGQDIPPAMYRAVKPKS